MTTARKVSSDLVMQMLSPMNLVEEWRSALMTFGEQCVIMDGM